MNNGRNLNDDERPTTKPSTIPPPLPPFRSVRMNVGPAPVMVQPQAFGSKAAPPPMMPGRNPVAVQGKMAPPKPVAFTSSSSSSSNQTMMNPSKNSFSTTSNKFVWKVDNLQQVPIYHPLERTAVTFGDEHPLDVITKRISNFMKDQSIFCSYGEGEGSARVVCSTNSCLHFSVQLWQKNGNTVMEIQRKQGCAIRMQSLRQQLKDSILFGEPSKTQDSGCPASIKQQLAKMIPPIPVSEQQGSCMDICQQMLSSNLVDQNRMGLESLCILTDASKVQDATTPSEKVLQDSKLQMSLLQYFASQEDANLHLLAVKAVTQALEATTATTTTASSSMIDLTSVFWQTVLQALYQHIQRPHEKPLEAALAIKSLRLLSAKSPECLEILQRKHSLPVTAFLQIAHEFGKQHSSSLEREAMQFMMANVH